MTTKKKKKPLPAKPKRREAFLESDRQVQFNFRVPPELERNFEIFCLRRGYRPREVLISWMLDALAAEPGWENALMGNGYGIYSHQKKQWLWGYIAGFLRYPPKFQDWRDKRIDIWPGQFAAERIIGWIPEEFEAVVVPEGQTEIPPYSKPEQK